MATCRPSRKSARPWPMGKYSDQRPFIFTLLLFPKYKFLTLHHNLPLTPTRVHPTATKQAHACWNGLHKHQLIPSMHCTGQLLGNFLARERQTLPTEFVQGAPDGIPPNPTDARSTPNRMRWRQAPFI